MRRKDREINDINEIFDILTRCDTVRIGFHGESFPYIVPVSFGAEMVKGKPVVYFHCARQGMKLDLLKANVCVCVEGDIFSKLKPRIMASRHGMRALLALGIVCFWMRRKKSFTASSS